MLTEKCKNQEADIGEFEMREQEFQEIESEAELLRRQVEASRYSSVKNHSLCLNAFSVTAATLVKTYPTFSDDSCILQR